MKTFYKDPSDILDYAWDFTEWLANEGDTISGHDIVIESGTITEAQASVESNGKVVAWLQGGTIGETAVVTCRITTVGNRQLDRSAQFHIKSK